MCKSPSTSYPNPFRPGITEENICNEMEVSNLREAQNQFRPRLYTAGGHNYITPQTKIQMEYNNFSDEFLET